MMQILVRHGLSVQEVTNTGYTLLMGAASGGYKLAAE
jgi:hypothetical protein